MTSKDIADALVARLGMSKAEARETVAMVLEAIATGIAKGDVSLAGFGKFSVSRRASWSQSQEWGIHRDRAVHADRVPGCEGLEGPAVRAMTRSVSDLAESLARRAMDLQRRADALLAELEGLVPERLAMGADEACPVIEDLDHATRIVAASARALDAAERRMRLLGAVMARFGEVMSDEGSADPEELRAMSGHLRLLLLDCTGQHAN